MSLWKYNFDIWFLSTWSAGEIVAMGSQNGSVYLFRVSRDGFSYKKSNKIRGTQPLMQLDWSSDSRFLQTVTQDYDLLFCKSDQKINLHWSWRFKDLDWTFRIYVVV